MTHILILEDEQMLRLSMARGLSKLSGVSVAQAGTVDDAVRAIQEQAPDIIVSDIDLPGRSGLELLGELGKRALRVPVIFASGYLKAYKSQIPQHADVDVLEKPVSLERLRELVTRRMRQSGPQEAAPFAMPDYLQLACMGRHSVELRVDQDNRQLGTVSVWRGQVVAARDLTGSGEAAFCRLAFASDTRVACRGINEMPAESNIEKSWEFLLMEAARLHDEADRRNGSSEDLETGFVAVQTDAEDAGPGDESQAAPAEEEAAPALEDRMFQRAWDRGIEALLDKDYKTALGAFVEAAAVRPLDGRVRANIQRLTEMGIEVDVTETTPEQGEIEENP